ncbi:hypothetical protein QQ045_030138 [Rhodiola kirilowii]
MQSTSGSNQSQIQQPPPEQPELAAAAEEAEIRTIWIGGLKNWMTELYLYTCFASTGEIANVKVIRSIKTGRSEGYGFVEFFSRATAEKVLLSYNGSRMPSTDKPYCINWAKSTDSGCDQYIFVPYLAPEVDSLHLREMFASTYQSVISATVAVDDKSSRSRGYGYVRFSDANERTRALTEVYGKYWLSRPVQFEVATPMQSAGNAHQHQQEYPSRAVELSERSSSNKAVHQGAQCENDPTNTTIYMFGVYSTVEDLRPRFSQFGVVIRITIPKGKRYAFVKFATRSEAEAAMEGLNGTVIGNQLVCLSWARSRAQRKVYDCRAIALLCVPQHYLGSRCYRSSVNLQQFCTI